MLGSTKPAASLSSGLLARKGQARPAMRPQGFHGSALNMEDLGWNDMGDEPHVAQTIAPAPAPLAPPVVASVPPVLVERADLAHEIGATVEPVAEPPRPVSAATVARINREVRAGKPKAAFTLRLDAERHLRLRLASASRNRSSQALVTEALDAYFESLTELDGLVSQLARPARVSGGKS